MNPAAATNAPKHSTGCEYRFAHPKRPRDTCNLPCQPGGTLCIWHNPAPRPQDANTDTQLQNAVQEPDHWLEGAILSDRQHLRALTLIGANLPGADFENVDLSDTVLAEACLDDAIFRGAILNATIFSRSSLTKAVLTGATG